MTNRPVGSGTTEDTSTVRHGDVSLLQRQRQHSCGSPTGVGFESGEMGARPSGVGDGEGLDTWRHTTAEAAEIALDMDADPG